MPINEPIENDELMKNCVRAIMTSLENNLRWPDQLKDLTLKRHHEEVIAAAVRDYSNHRVILVFKAALEAMELLNKK